MAEKSRPLGVSRVCIEEDITAKLIESIFTRDAARRKLSTTTIIIWGERRQKSLLNDKNVSQVACMTHGGGWCNPPPLTREGVHAYTHNTERTRPSEEGGWRKRSPPLYAESWAGAEIWFWRVRSTRTRPWGVKWFMLSWVGAVCTLTPLLRDFSKIYFVWNFSSNTSLCEAKTRFLLLLTF